MNQLFIKKLTQTATIPTRATTGSAGYDLYADLSSPVIIRPNQVKMINTGISIALNSEYFAAFIYARSGLATKFSIAPANCVGVIDSDYRGEIIVALKNSGECDFEVKPNERIAQMVIAPVVLPELIVADDLTTTDRGNGGFGSTGLN